MMGNKKTGIKKTTKKTCLKEPEKIIKQRSLVRLSSKYCSEKNLRSKFSHHIDTGNEDVF